MATFLTTRKMSAALAGRIEASVRGRRSLPGKRLAPRAIAWLRVGALGLCVLVAGSVARVRAQANDELAEQRSSLLDRVHTQAASLGGREQRTIDLVRTWLERSAQGHVEDFVSESLRGEEELQKTLSQPIIYVRGVLDSFRSEAGILASAASSSKDAFVLCLLHPPSERTERALLGRARASHGGGQLFRRMTSQVERLQSIFAVRPFLEPAWREQIPEAGGRRELARLGRELDRAPFESARRAVEARLLLFLMDEPSDTPGPTELDGERPHPVRIGLVELEADKLAFLLRRRVDPRWLSDGARAEYARAIDSCALAMDVRATISGSHEPPPRPRRRK